MDSLLILTDENDDDDHLSLKPTIIFNGCRLQIFKYIIPRLKTLDLIKSAADHPCGIPIASSNKRFGLPASAMTFHIRDDTSLKFLASPRLGKNLNILRVAFPDIAMMFLPPSRTNSVLEAPSHISLYPFSRQT